MLEFLGGLPIVVLNAAFKHVSFLHIMSIKFATTNGAIIRPKNKRFQNKNANEYIEKNQNSKCLLSHQWQNRMR